MKKKVVVITVLITTVVLLSIILTQMNKNCSCQSTENYKVDISGGFKPPCGCQGDCVLNF